MGLFERYLTVWVFLCIIAGIALGHFFPTPFKVLGSMEFAQVNLVDQISVLQEHDDC